ncbi:lysophospholipid acyltransferase family protein [Nakamurella endophytica]|uniref:Phospholipid/glycerol acyltransferase domain-containing protein n=1 Tax=Nakamurella endophytica TaxID=1748367 RepID=A0A917WBS0_9ACTN|nr:lysophospholipid acyltransferase family protein [Nakamurella endophytica]GGL89338.1 hypothetical protein GCM10011594_06150 [Nakamurella endophytica]
MTEHCAEMRCAAACVAAPTPRAPLGTRVRRRTALTAALLAGGAAIVLVALLPGYGRPHRTGRVLQHASRWVLAALGVRVRCTGRPRAGASLVVGNHVSFLDVLALAACGPMRPVAKQDVASWPFVGGLARRTGTLFLRRDTWAELPDLVRAATAALRAGHRVQVFPEGTTRCGRSLGTFRRAAFQAAMDAAAVVSPVALRYTDGTGARSAAAPFVGDETLLQALRRVVAAPRLELHVQWLRPVPAIPATGHPATDRRRLASAVESAVARALGQDVVRSAPVRPSRPVAVGLPVADGAERVGAAEVLELAACAARSRPPVLQSA